MPRTKKPKLCLWPVAKPKQDCTQELLASRQEYILQRGFEMARLLEESTIEDPRWDGLTSALLELSGATNVYCYHPHVVESFFQQAVMTAIAEGKDGKPDVRTQLVLNEIQALLDKSTPQRVVQEIADRHSGGNSSREPSTAYKATCLPSEFPNGSTSSHKVVDLSCWRQSRPRPLKGVTQ